MFFLVFKTSATFNLDISISLQFTGAAQKNEVMGSIFCPLMLLFFSFFLQLCHVTGV